MLDRAYINQLASSDFSPSSRNIVLKASVTIERDTYSSDFANNFNSIVGVFISALSSNIY